MSATTTTSPARNALHGMFAVLQRVGRSLMMPIAVLPAAALLLRFGQADMLGADGLGWEGPASVLAAAGGALFDNLPILFAVGVAIGFARRADGSTALAAVVGYLVFDNVFTTLTEDNVINDEPVTMGVLGGILVGLTTALLYQRFYRIKLPDWLAFFGGRRFVPIVTAFATMLLAVVCAAIWPPVGEAINSFGEWITGAGAFGAGVYGVVNRALLPFGLHHIVNSLVWFVFGSYEGAHGDLNRFFAGDPTAGTFMAGFFPIMMFGLPAAAIAIVHEARPERRAAVGGIMLSAGLTALVTGVTEPIEFAFLFVAPLLFAIHAVLTGISMALVAALDVKHGFGFSAGLIDYLLNYNIATKPWLLVPIGAVYAAVYYLLFRAVIRRFDLPTPGRERDAETTDAAVPAEATAPASGGSAVPSGSAGSSGASAAADDTRPPRP
ncbi:MAG: PTS transporter subunit EIIC [Actinomycetes bacterium]